jgi:hypothetical protein
MRGEFEKVPDKNNSFAQVLSGVLAHGIFVSSTANGKLVVYSEKIHFAILPSLPTTGVKNVWVAPSEQEMGEEEQIIPHGFVEGFWEFNEGQTKREVIANEQLLDLMAKSPKIDRYNSMEILLEFAIKTAESWEITGHIGGPVDSLELSADWKMRWIHVKKGCGAPIQ